MTVLIEALGWPTRLQTYSILDIVGAQCPGRDGSRQQFATGAATTVGRRHVRAVSLPPEILLLHGSDRFEFVPRFKVGEWHGPLMPLTVRFFGSAFTRKAITWFFAGLAQGDDVTPCGFPLLNCMWIFNLVPFGCNNNGGMWIRVISCSRDRFLPSMGQTFRHVATLHYMG